MKKRKSILQTFNNFRLGTKMMIAFVFGAIIPIIIIQIASYSVNSSYMQRRVDELVQTNLLQIAERVDLTLEVYSNVLYQMYVDEDIIRHVNVLLEDDEDEKAASYYQISNRIKQYDMLDEYVRCISIVCVNGTTVVSDVRTDSALNHLWKDYEDLRESDAYINATGNPGVAVTPTMEFSDEEYIFHISKELYDLNNLGKGAIGTVILSIDADMLNQICISDLEDNDSVGGEKDSFTFIMDDERKVIAYPEEMFMGIRLSDEITVEKFIEISGLMTSDRTAVNEYADSSTGWNFYHVYDTGELLRDMRRSLAIFTGIGVAALLVSSLLILYTVRVITGSVRNITTGMQEVQEGNLEVQLPVKYEDEIGQISANFNEMVGDIRNLITEVEQVSDMKRNAEIRALEAQINPHFLYNTLDSINWMAIERGEYEISKMLRDLGVILRYSINKSNELVTITELTDWLEKYIGLQKVRFNDAFDYYLTVEEGIGEKRIYRLLLQPFIENAIIHGFSGIEFGGILNIDIFREETLLCIIIEDNGRGMKPEQVQQFNDRAAAVKDDERGIGLHNAFCRMDMYYGEAAQWQVTSREEQGTVITIKLPYM